MPEPFKNMISKKVIAGMASHFKKHWPDFNADGFIVSATKNLNSLELKERTDQVTDAMHKYFPPDFAAAGKMMLASLGSPVGGETSGSMVDIEGITGWAVIPMTNYVGLYGGRQFELSMTLFKEMTKRATAEFGIRHFLLEHPEETLSVLRLWAADEDYHVRRLVSEGIRPRLPWASRLSAFVKDPFPVIELLELLKDDDKEYVRRSVANNLNDISKDHPDLVADIAERWLKEATKEREKLVSHACRTLKKKGHKKTLQILGFGVPRIKKSSINILTPELKFGDSLQFELIIISDLGKDQDLMIDYIIHHQKANGTTSPKVFKWRTTTLQANEKLSLTKKHAIKKITTRIYYPGLHVIEVMVNGVSLGTSGFQLIM